MEQTPTQRAEAAAEELAADGQAVTARAVRTASGVRMTVAAEAARAWNERVDQEGKVPDMPATFVARAEAMWRATYADARDAFAAERSGWEGRVVLAEQEAGQLRADVDEMEAQLTTAQEAVTEARKLVDELRRDLARVEGESSARKAEAEQLRVEVREVRAQLDNERTRADRAEARAEALTESRPSGMPVESEFHARVRKNKPTA